MELFLEVDPAIRQVVPSVLDAAGMGEDATKLREFEPVLNIGVVVRVCTLLQSIREAQGVAILPGTWAEVVAEAAFWAEGALWAAADGDIELLSDCMKMIRKAVQDGYSLGVSH